MRGSIKKPLSILGTLLLCAVTLFHCGPGVNPLDRADGSGGDGSGSPIAVTSITPSSGARGTTVTIQGQNFAEGVKVQVGGVLCRDVSLASATELSCWIGALGPGTASVQVTLGSETVSLESAFTYLSFLYVPEVETATINELSLSATGTMTPVGTFSAGGAPGRGGVVDGRGRFLYIANDSAATYSGFSIDRNTGSIEAPLTGSAFPAANSINHAVADPEGNFIVVGRNASSGSDVLSFSIDQSTGALGSLSSAGTGVSARGMAITPDFRFVYVGSSGSNTHGFSLSASGSLSNLGGMPVSGGASPTRVLGISSGGTLLFTAKGNVGVTIQPYRIASDGTLTALATFNTSLDHSSALGHLQNPWLYLFGGTDRVYSYDEQGTLSVVGNLPSHANWNFPMFDPSGNFLVMSASQTVFVYRVSSDGNLALAGQRDFGGPTLGSMPVN